MTTDTTDTTLPKPVLVGEHEHSFDDKGRIVLPASFRTHIPSGYLAPYQGCVALWSDAEFARVAANLKERVLSGEIHDRVRRAFTSSASVAKPDAQGRIMIPQNLRDYASLGASVKVVGADDRVEIWNVEAWRDQLDPGLAEYEAATALRGL